MEAHILRGQRGTGVIIGDTKILSVYVTESMFENQKEAENIQAFFFFEVDGSFH